MAFTLVPPLEQGGHLTRDEFERRYEAMPNLTRLAEVVRQGVAGPEHQAFVARLREDAP